MILTDDGNFESGERLLNWIWYCNIVPDSKEMTEIFTDINGKCHRNTVPSDLLRFPTWERYRASGVTRMAAPFVELVEKASRLFVTKIYDFLSSQRSFHHGQVILVGESLARFRPHLALVTDHAAWQCLTRADSWKGKILEADCGRMIVQKSERLWRLGKLLGMFGQGLWFSLLETTFLYFAFLLKTKLSWALSAWLCHHCGIAWQQVIFELVHEMITSL